MRGHISEASSGVPLGRLKKRRLAAFAQAPVPSDERLLVDESLIRVEIFRPCSTIPLQPLRCRLAPEAEVPPP